MGKQIFSIEALAADKGDCLLIHSGTQDHPRLILIDGGPTKVYRAALRKRLRELVKDNGHRPRVVDLMIVSHLDDDHIGGILELVQKEVEELKKPGRQLDIRCLWHNAFSDILDDATSPIDLSPDGVASLGAGQTLPGLGALAADDRMVLASVAQGRSLRDGIRPLQDAGMALNAPFGTGNLVMVSAPPDAPITRFGGNLAATVIGPLPDEVEKLRKLWQKYLTEKGLGKPAADAEVLAALRKDVSVTNLSSIVVLLRQGDRAVLLTGDARGDRILAGLEAQGELAPGGEMDIDVLKIPHHGSPRNNDADFLRRVKARHYVFSGNGEHGNPDRATLETLARARAGHRIHLHFTHDIATIDANRQDHAERYDKGWDPATHSLAAWCATCPAEISVTFATDFRGITVDLRKGDS